MTEEVKELLNQTVPLTTEEIKKMSKELEKVFERNKDSLYELDEMLDENGVLDNDKLLRRQKANKNIVKSGVRILKNFGLI